MLHGRITRADSRHFFARRIFVVNPRGATATNINVIEPDAATEPPVTSKRILIGSYSIVLLDFGAVAERVNLAVRRGGPARSGRGSPGDVPAGTSPG